MPKKDMTRIGRTTDGRPLELDINMRKMQVGASLSGYSLDEQIDILCVLEYTVRKRLVEGLPRSYDEDCLETALDHLDKTRQEKEFSDRLDERGLRTSIDRLRHCEKIAL